MKPEKFCHLAEIYGSNLQRWPATEQAAARQLLDSGSTTAAHALRQAAQLDDLLDGHLVPAIDPAWVRQIRLSAPPKKTTLFSSLYANWLSRLSFIGAGIAGIAAGILVVSLGLPAPTTWVDALPSFIEPGCADSALNIRTEDIN